MEVIWVGSLCQCCGLSFEMGIIVVRFQRWGIVLMLRVVLHMFGGYLMASGPRCLICLMFIPSGSIKLFFVLFEMANRVFVVVSWDGWEWP